MTDDELKDLLAGKPDDVFQWVHNVVAQRDDALDRIEAADAEKATLLAAKDAEIEVLTAAKDAEIEGLRVEMQELAATKAAELDALAAAKAAEIEALTAANVKLKALIDSMGGTEVGQQLAREKRAAELQAAMDAADAAKQQAADELATLESGILK